ncbi:Myc-type, basic helix-loop-helix domain-containing protein [Tanacetum coccineum]
MRTCHPDIKEYAPPILRDMSPMMMSSTVFKIDMDMTQGWLAELEMEDPGYMSCDQTDILYDDIDNFSLDSFYSHIYTEKMTNINQTSLTRQSEVNNPSYQEKCGSTINKISTTLEPLIPPNLSSSKTFTLSFGDLKPKDEPFQFHDLLGYEAAHTTKVSITLRNPIQAQDHVLAERKRRERLNRKFITLSNVLPNLKKMDKASMLEDASNYIKELEGRVKELEGTLESNKRKNVDHKSVISMKRSKPSSSDDEYYLRDEPTISGESTAPCKTTPEIEAYILGNTLTVSIQCQKNHSSFMKALTQMEKLGLSIISSSSMPFANTHLIITIIAQIVDDFSMTTTELVKNLQQSI